MGAVLSTAGWRGREADRAPMTSGAIRAMSSRSWVGQVQVHHRAACCLPTAGADAILRANW